MPYFFLSQGQKIRRKEWREDYHLCFKQYDEWPDILSVEPALSGINRYYANRRDLEATDWKVAK